MNLLQLIAALEQPTLLNRTLDAHITLEVHKASLRCYSDVWFNEGEWWWHLPSFARRQPVPRYTTSLDAALTLIPEGWRLYSMSDQNWYGTQKWHVGLDERGRAAPVSIYAPTPALALCIASLKARANNVPS